jgi:hypothetical protein
MNKKTVFFILAVLALAAAAYGVEPIDYSKDDSYNLDYLGNRTHLPDYTWRLRNTYGIITYIYRDLSEGDYDLYGRAGAYYRSLNLEPDKKAIVIFASKRYKKGEIILTDNLKEVFPEKRVEAVREYVLNDLYGRWYISDAKVFIKVTGTFLYLLEREQYTKERMSREKGAFVLIDNFGFRLANAPMIRDLIKLFFFEPISFIFYFPFVMYFLIVRVIGFSFGKDWFYFFNGVWGGVMLFFIFLILNRLNILFPEYVAAFLLFSALNTPLYVYLYAIYEDQIFDITSNYIEKVTGGFGAEGSVFEGKNNIG